MGQSDDKELVRAVNELNRNLGLIVKTLERTNGTLIAVAKYSKEEAG